MHIVTPISPTNRKIVAALLAAICSVVPAEPTAVLRPEQPLAQRRRPLGRSFDGSQQGTTNSACRVPKPAVISKSQWGGAESKAPIRDHVPVNLTLHHVATATALKLSDDPTSKLAGIQKWGWEARKWPDLPYHFLIDLEGRIYEGRNVLKVGDTNTKYDPAGHFLVSMIGNYEVQMPTEKQLDAIADLMAWGSDYFNIDPGTIGGHKDHVEGTACPGRYFYPYVVSGYLEGEVRSRIAKAYGVVPADETTTAPPVTTTATSAAGLINSGKAN